MIIVAFPDQTSHIILVQKKNQESGFPYLAKLEPHKSRNSILSLGCLKFYAFKVGVWVQHLE